MQSFSWKLFQCLPITSNSSKIYSSFCEEIPDETNRVKSLKWIFTKSIFFQCADAYMLTFKSLYTYIHIVLLTIRCTRACEWTPKFFSLYSPEDRIEYVPRKWHSKQSLSFSPSLSHIAFHPFYRFWLLPFADCTPLGH